MLPNLTVQLAQDTPVVYLFDECPPVSRIVASIFQEKGLSVNLINDLAHINISVTPYKVVWVVEAQTFSLETLETVKKLVSDLSAPLIVVMPITTPINDNETYKKWTSRSQKQKSVITTISTELVFAHCIFIENVLSEQYDNPVLKTTIEMADRGVLFDPKVPIALINLDDVSDSLQEPLLRPGFQQSVLLRGQETEFSDIVSRQQQHYEFVHKHKTEIRPVAVTLDRAIPFTVQSKIINSDLTEILNAAIRMLPKPLPSPRLVAQQVDTTPLPKPLKTATFTNADTNADSDANAIVGVISRENLPDIKPSLTPQLASIAPEVATSIEVAEPVPVQPAPPADVNEELQRIFATTRTEHKVKHVVKLAEVEHKIVKKSRHKKVLFWGGLSVVGAGMGLASLILCFYLSTITVKTQLLGAVEKANAQTLTEKDLSSLDLTTNILEFQTKHYTALFDNSMVSQASELVELSDKVQTLAQSTSVVDDTLLRTYQMLFQAKPETMTDLVAKLQKESATAYEMISFIQAQLKNIDFKELSEKQKQDLATFEVETAKKTKDISAIQQLSPLLHHLLGDTQPRTYALVFQNNQELRPTGGFIQSVALVTVSKGQIIDTQSYSSYALDEKVSGVVTPPEEIKQLLGEERWFLRDSNWNPDFSSTAEQIKWFVENTTDKNIDGVMAVDVYGFEKLLESLGPVELPQFNEVITSKNVAERLEFHSEVTLVNSDKNPDYSTVLLSALLDKMKTAPEEKINLTYSALLKMVRENNLLLSLADENENMTLKNLGWAGSLVSPDCPTALNSVPCVLDSVAQIEANIGVNKANYYIEKSINHSVVMSETTLEHTRTITYQNTAQTSTWPKGNYKAFVRLYLPTNTVLKNIYFDTTALAPEQITTKEENGKKVFGFSIEVPINSQSVLEIQYDQPHDKVAPFSYAFFEQKQPGTPITPFTLTVVPPPMAEAAIIAPAAQVHSQTVVFQEDQKNNLFYGIQFKQK